MENKCNPAYLFLIFLAIFGILFMDACKPNTEKLGKAGDIDNLIKALEHKNWEVRRDAAMQLGKLRDPHSIEPLIQAVNDDKREVWSSAREALLEIGEPAVEPLIKATGDDGDYYNDDAFFRLLADFSSENTIDYFVPALDSETSGRFLVEVAADALLRIGAPAVEPLLIALEENNIADQAVVVLDHMDWEPKIDIDHIWYFARTDQFDQIEEFGPEAIPVLLELSNNSYEDWDIRMKAAESLVKLNAPQVLETFIAWLDEEKEEVQILSAQLMGLLGDEKAIVPLLSKLKDDDSGFRFIDNVFNSLEELGKPLISEWESVFLSLGSICSNPEEWEGVDSLDVQIPDQFYPVIALKNPGVRIESGYIPFEWTALTLFAFEPIYSSSDLQIACVNQDIRLLEKCWYLGASRYRYIEILEIVLRDANTGSEIASNKFRSEDPPMCPGMLSLNDPTTDTIQTRVNLNEVTSWHEYFIQ